jgi:dCTP deaminase
MILTDKQILKEIENGTIVIEPFDIKNLGSNSYDVHLGKYLAKYNNDTLDSKLHNTIRTFEIPKDGYTLVPNKLYLGVTEEYTETHIHVPFLEGKSSTGRLGINIHATAGKGDVGYCNNWTLELYCIQPVKVYEGMPIGQLIYYEVQGNVKTKYHKKKSAKYVEKTDKPVESMMFKNKF